MQTNLSPFQISHEKTAAELTRLFTAARKSPDGPVLGLTKTDITYSLDANVSQRSFLGQSCGTPQITVAIAYKTPEIYVAQELPEDSCLYNAVLDHEGLHVATYEKHVTTLAAEIRQLLSKRYPDGFMFKGVAPTAMALRMKMLVDEELPSLIETAITQSTEAQQALDSRAAYTRLIRTCVAGASTED